jgi:cell division protein FtsB
MPSTAWSRGRRPPEPVECRGSMPRRKRPSRSTLALRWLGVIGLVAIGLAYVHPLRSYHAARERVVERRAELVAVEREIDRLDHRLALSGEDSFVEREARRLGLVRPGEHLFIVKGVEARRRASVP